MALLFIGGVLAVSESLTHHSSPIWQIILLAYPILMLIAYFTRHKNQRAPLAMLASALLLVNTALAPLSLEAIEEAFILTPLLLLMCSRGKFWALYYSLALCAAYYLHFSHEDGLLEDSIELLLITGFATLMAYYQVKTEAMMNSYRQESLTDYLTQIPNRKAFYTELKQLSEHKQAFTLILLDLDDFKRINDQLGHQWGDVVLREFARRIENIGQFSNYRIGGDEFAIIVNNPSIDVDLIAQQILQKTSGAYQLHHQQQQVNCTLGIAQNHANAKPEEVQQQADIALYYAKELGKNTYAIFNLQMQEKIRRQQQLEMGLREAISEQQFSLQYQAKVDVTSNQIVGCEALLRWQHPEWGAISPAEFIPVAEKSGQIIEIGRWVMHRACQQAAQWQQAGFLIPVAVNVSAIQLEQDQINELITSSLQTTRLAAHLLQIEITESSYISDLLPILPKLRQLLELGVTLAIDDFGVAYSSLSQLTQMPAQVLKIDRCFIDQCASDERTRMLVSTIITLGHKLGMKIVAEGVETDAQLAVLRAEGCDQYQGFYFSRPVSAAALTQQLAQQLT
ncbi:bifunctional diguanylate cyclase/phosphodiesterase [Chitinibacter sp. SCUT-21]|uniref:putative bifunctional diguanylate cyclase/phosphodiesterase n=1 Tax=Chitinibacter sp. SCUT-21 TaxID=2970891 RepID=UPI0035A5C11F